MSTHMGTPSGMYSRSTAIERTGVKGAPSAPSGPSSAPSPLSSRKKTYERFSARRRPPWGVVRATHGCSAWRRLSARAARDRPAPCRWPHTASHCARRSRHARRVLRAGEPVRSPRSAERRRRSRSPDRGSAAHDCPMRRLRLPRGPKLPLVILTPIPLTLIGIVLDTGRSLRHSLRRR